MRPRLLLKCLSHVYCVGSLKAPPATRSHMEAWRYFTARLEQRAVRYTRETVVKPAGTVAPVSISADVEYPLFGD